MKNDTKIIILIILSIIVIAFVFDATGITGKIVATRIGDLPLKRPIVEEPISKIEIPTCQDSDGINYYTKGKATDSKYPGGLYDYCEEDMLIEYKCKFFKAHDKWAAGYYATTISHACPFGCKDGACIYSTAVKCTDDDGGKNYYKKGKTSGVYGNAAGTSWDYCTDNKLTEFYCIDNNKYGPTHIDCEFGCKDGACIKVENKCKDTDNFDLSKKGTVTDPVFPNGLTDYCKDNYNVYEYYCKYFPDVPNQPPGYYATSWSFSCPAGCKNGRCVEATEQCTDSDGFNLNTRGTAVDSNFPNGLTDYCKDKYNVYEFYCKQFQTSANAPAGLYATSKEYVCLNGCKDGACK